MMFGWRVRRSAIVTSVMCGLLALVVAFGQVLLSPYPEYGTGWRLMAMLPVFWLFGFVYGCLLDNTNKL